MLALAIAATAGFSLTFTSEYINEWHYFCCVYTC